MRVISGTARGKNLLPVSGMDTRPTTDRVKESIFNIIQTQVRGARVLDLFAGTGQMGIEALSRGAKHADFVDQSKNAADSIRKNIAGARVEERASVHVGEACEFVKKRTSKSYDIIFLDPPYGGELLQRILIAVETFDILAPDGIIICESAVDDAWVSPLEDARVYRYGTVKVTVLRA